MYIKITNNLDLYATSTNSDRKSENSPEGVEESNRREKDNRINKRMVKPVRMIKFMNMLMTEPGKKRDALHLC